MHVCFLNRKSYAREVKASHPEPGEAVTGAKSPAPVAGPGEDGQPCPAISHS